MLAAARQRGNEGALDQALAVDHRVIAFRSQRIAESGDLRPGGSPPLHQETQKALALPSVQAKFAPQGIEAMPMRPAEFDALITKEIAANIALVKAAGLTFN